MLARNRNQNVKGLIRVNILTQCAKYTKMQIFDKVASVWIDWVTRESLYEIVSRLGKRLTVWLTKKRWIWDQNFQKGISHSYLLPSTYWSKIFDQDINVLSTQFSNFENPWTWIGLRIKGVDELYRFICCSPDSWIDSSIDIRQLHRREIKMTENKKARSQYFACTSIRWPEHWQFFFMIFNIIY